MSRFTFSAAAPSAFQTGGHRAETHLPPIRHPLHKPPEPGARQSTRSGFSASTQQPLPKDFRPDDHEGCITLSTHNVSAEAINEVRLKGLPDKLHSFHAEIEGDFPEYLYPTLAHPHPEKGGPGDVRQERSFARKTLFQRQDRPDHPDRRPVPSQLNARVMTMRSRWSPQFGKTSSTGSIQRPAKSPRKKVGRFEQLPLKLAWAITIHKSQGLTFERAVIDAGAAFAHGQVYVALSRCKTFEGLVLSSPIPACAIKSDRAVSRFAAEMSENPPSVEGLETAKILYQQRLLTECFDFARLRSLLGRLVRVLRSNTGQSGCRAQGPSRTGGQGRGGDIRGR